MRWIKIGGLIFCSLAVIIVVAILGLVFLLNPNQLKPTLINEVKKATGYELTIVGNLSWSFFPKMSIHAERMLFAESQQKPPFLELRQVNLTADMKAWWHHREPLEGEVTIKEIQWSHLKLQNANIGMHRRPHNLALHPFTASLYEGKMQAAISRMNQTAMPAWDIQLQLEQVNAQSLLADMQDGHIARFNVSGRADVQSHLKMQGRNKTELLHHLKGTIDLKLKDGIINGIDLNYLMQMANALINKQSLPSVALQDQTRVDNISGHVVINDGIANTDHLLLSAPQFAAKIEGSANLTNRILDLHLQVAPLQTAKPWLIPMKLTGDWSHPKAELDMLKLDSLIAREQFEKIKEKVQKQVKELPKKASELLKKLLQ